MYIRITGARRVKHFLETILLVSGFCFFFLVIGELVRTSPWRILVTLDGPEFYKFLRGHISTTILVAFFSDIPDWVLTDGQMQE
jgi:hypothetical protein